jgi:hypothetical protein
MKFFTNYKYYFSLQDDNQQHGQVNSALDKWKKGFLSDQQLIEVLKIITNKKP